VASAIIATACALGEKALPTAMTGVAAAAQQGQTVHSFLKLQPLNFAEGVSEEEKAAQTTAQLETLCEDTNTIQRVANIDVCLLCCCCHVYERNRDVFFFLL